MDHVAKLTPEAAVGAELAATVLRGLDAALDAKESVGLRFEGTDVEVEIPRSAVQVLTLVLDGLAHSDGVTVVSSQSELTPQQAAQALDISPSNLDGLLDNELIEYHQVGGERRIDTASLADYLRRRAAVDALSAETYELGFA